MIVISFPGLCQEKAIIKISEGFNMDIYLLITIFVIVIFAIVMVYELFLKGYKALVFQFDTDYENSKHIVFVAKPRSYKIVRKHGSLKINLSGCKDLIPYNPNNLNPSKFKRYGLVLVEVNGTYVPVDVRFSMDQIMSMEEVVRNGKLDKIRSIKSEFVAIPYDQKSNWLNTNRAIESAFKPDTWFKIGIGILSIALIVFGIMIYLTSENWLGIAQSFGGIKEMLSGIIPK